MRILLAVINSAILFINSCYFNSMVPPFEIRSIKGDEIIWTDPVKPTPSGLYLPACTPFSCMGGWGNMDFQFALKPRFSIWHSRYKMTKRGGFTARSKEPLLELSLQMDHPVSYHALPLNHQTVKTCQFNLFYLPYMESRADFEVGQLTTTLDIHCKKDYLLTLAEHFPDIIIPFLDKVTAGTATSIFPEPLYATGFMLYAARNIISLLRTNPPNDYLLELNVQTLLSYALTCKYELNPKTKKISLEQISYIYSIRNRLSTDFSRIPNLSELAKEARMSLTAFKNVFKNEFGIAAYHYWVTNRMNEAYQRLMHTDDTVSQISFDLAFPNVSNFSKAFKEHFGFPPTELR